MHQLWILIFVGIIEFRVLVTGQNSCPNVALRRPAFQSSDYIHQRGHTSAPNGDRGVASRAVDGNNNVLFRSLSCTHTNSDNNAWWAVDLGVSTCVSYVKVTTRGGVHNRIQNFNFGLTNTNPVAVAPVLGSYTRCANINLQAGATTDITCPPNVCGRYLIVQLPNKDQLMLCEVEVYQQRYCSANTGCLPNPCLNGGVCANRLNTFSCACTSGFSGSRCEIGFDSCSGNCKSVHQACDQTADSIVTTCLVSSERGYETCRRSCTTTSCKDSCMRVRQTAQSSCKTTYLPATNLCAMALHACLSRCF